MSSRNRVLACHILNQTATASRCFVIHFSNRQNGTLPTSLNLILNRCVVCTEYRGGMWHLPFIYAFSKSYDHIFS